MWLEWFEWLRFEWLEQVWIKHLLLILAINKESIMDAINFDVDRGKGWWSIHPDKFKYNIKLFGWNWDFDGWHTFKKIFMLLIGLAVFGHTIHFYIYACYNFGLHNIFYHKVYKPLFIKYNRRKR